MRNCVKALCFLALSVLPIQAGPAKAAPLSPPVLAGSAEKLVHTVGHRAYRRIHHHHARHGVRYRKHSHWHRNSRRGWLPPLKEHRHLPGNWNHARCNDWHRCHYYFYGYRQWAKWNPDKSRAYFRRHYHH